MPLELINTFVTLGTFVVIAATAIAAIVQLRHAAAAITLSPSTSCAKQRDARLSSGTVLCSAKLSAKLQDPAFRYQIATRSAGSDETRPLFAKINAIGNYYENLGVLVKTGLVDREPVLQLGPASSHRVGKISRRSQQSLAADAATWCGRISNI